MNEDPSSDQPAKGPAGNPYEGPQPVGAESERTEPLTISARIGMTVGVSMIVTYTLIIVVTVARIQNAPPQTRIHSYVSDGLLAFSSAAICGIGLLRFLKRQPFAWAFLMAAVPALLTILLLTNY